LALEISKAEIQPTVFLQVILFLLHMVANRQLEKNRKHVTSSIELRRWPKHLDVGRVRVDLQEWGVGHMAGRVLGVGSGEGCALPIQNFWNFIAKNSGFCAFFCESLLVARNQDLDSIDPLRGGSRCNMQNLKI